MYTIRFCEAIECSNYIDDFHEYLESKLIVAEIGENKFIYKYDGFDFDLGTESFINFIESKISTRYIIKFTRAKIRYIYSSAYW